LVPDKPPQKTNADLKPAGTLHVLVMLLLAVARDRRPGKEARGGTAQAGLRTIENRGNKERLPTKE